MTRRLPDGLGGTGRPAGGRVRRGSDVCTRRARARGSRRMRSSGAPSSGRTARTGPSGCPPRACSMKGTSPVPYADSPPVSAAVSNSPFSSPTRSTCCCSTNPPTTSPRHWSRSWRQPSPTTEAPWSRSRTTAGCARLHRSRTDPDTSRSTPRAATGASARQPSSYPHPYPYPFLTAPRVRPLSGPTVSRARPPAEPEPDRSRAAPTPRH